MIHVSDGVDALVERLRAEDGDGELLGGPSLIRAFWQRGEIHDLGLLILPMLFSARGCRCSRWGRLAAAAEAHPA